jgi:predicted metal-dependent peptidase
MADLEKAKRKIDGVIFKLWRKDAVMFGALSMLDKIPDPNFDTLGVDVSHSDRVSLRYNPNFINTISIERLELVLAIEGFRVLLRHCTTRLREPPNISHLASSLAINQLLNSDLEKLLQGFDECSPDPKRFGLEDNQAYEEYYRSLLEKSDKTNKMIQKIWGQMSKDEKQKCVDDAIGKGEQAQDEREENSDSDNFQEFKDEADAMKKHGNPNGNAHQGWGKNNGFDADVKAFVDKVRSKTRMWGKYTGTAQAQILAALDPKVSCKDIIRRFGASIITGTTVTSRMKVNRRWDIDRPGYRRVYKPHVIFAIDVSGSMTDEDLAFGFGVINKLLFFAKITFVEFDTEIKKVEKNFNKAKKSFHVHGRGGTDFEHIMTMADEEKVDGLVVYTDGCAPAPHQPKCKMLWLLHAKGAKPPVDWGLRTYLDRFEDCRVW